MRKSHLGAFVLMGFGVTLSASAPAFTLLGTKWGMGPNVAQDNTGNLGTPGRATWSIMGAGLSMSGVNDNHGANPTINFGSLIGGATTAEEVAAINSALNTWAAVCGFSNLGQVADGGANCGASNANNGHIGDIRLGAAPAGFSGELAHAWQPLNANLGGGDWNKGGDLHVDSSFTWVDDPTDTNADGDFDLHTVLLHELGHCLGLGHSTVAGSVMEPVYAGARRSLHADDIAGIRAIYGIVPEPTTMAVLGIGVLAAMRRRRK